MGSRGGVVVGGLGEQQMGCWIKSVEMIIEAAVTWCRVALL